MDISLAKWVMDNWFQTDTNWIWTIGLGLQMSFVFFWLGMSNGHERPEKGSL